MYTLCANYEDLGLGEGYTVEAYSKDLDCLKKYAEDDAVRQKCEREHLKWFQINETVWALKQLYTASADPTDDDNYDTWVVIEFDKFFKPPTVVNVDERYN